MMKALVTGASGFIGSTLIEELGRRGFEPYALMRRTSSAANLKGCRFERREGDLRDPAALRRAVEGMDYVFHLAGIVTALSREEFFEHNAGGTARLGDAVAEANPGLKRFVYVSSMAASGPSASREPRTEDQPDAPVSQYGHSKRQGEFELLRHRDRYPIVILRPPIVYGPRDRGVFTMIEGVAKNVMALPRAKSPDGHKWYSHVHARDLVEAMIAAALAPVERVPTGEVFHVASDDVVTGEQLMRVMADHLGKARPWRITMPRPAIWAAGAAMSALSQVTRRSYPLNLDKVNEIQADYWVCSNAKAKRLLGFRPRYDLTRGMGETIQWYKAHGWL